MMAISGLLTGIILTPPALFLAIISAGLGHGHYIFARLLFSVPVLATLVTNNQISAPLRLAALLQFPVYGLLIASSRRKVLVFSAVLIVHLVAAVICFSGVIPNFS